MRSQSKAANYHKVHALSSVDFSEKKENVSAVVYMHHPEQYTLISNIQFKRKRIYSSLTDAQQKQLKLAYFC